MNIGQALQRAAAGRPWWLAGNVPASAVKAAYQPKGAASYAASLVNRANPGTNDAVATSSPAWDTAVGWTFGIGNYLDTGIVPGEDYSIIARFSGLQYTGASKALAGCLSATTDARFYLMPHLHSDNYFRFAWGDSWDNVSSRIDSGVMAIANGVGYLDGSIAVAALSGSWKSLVKSIFIGTFNTDTGPLTTAWFVDGVVTALAIYSSPLTGPQVAAITKAMQRL